MANNPYQSLNTLNLVGGILGGLGDLTNAVNTVIQTSKGRVPIPIGNFGTAIGGTLETYAKNKSGQIGKQYAQQALSQMQGLDPTTKQIAQAQIWAGTPDEAFKTVVSTMNSGNTNDTKNFEYYLKTLPPGQMPMSFEEYTTAMKRAGSTSISLGPDTRVMMTRFTQLSKDLNDPVKTGMMKANGTYDAAVNEYSTIGKMLNYPAAGFGTSQTTQPTQPVLTPTAPSKKVYDPSTGTFK